MRFIAVKSAEQQSVLMLHRTRELLVRQRTMLVNALRGHCGEFGIVAAQGLSRAGDLIKRIEDPADTALPDLARQALQCLTSQIRAIQEQIALIEKKLLAWHSSCEASRRLAEIPGVGPITATAVVASVGNATQFRSARQFAAWLGLVPQQHSSGGKERLGHISKRGDGYIRRLLVHGARAHLSWSRRKKQIRSAWLTGLLARRPTNVVLLAMANKTARIAWAMLSRGERYQEMIAAAAGSSSSRQRDCEGDDAVMAKQGNRDRPNPRLCPSDKLVKLMGRRSSDSTRASGHRPRHKAG
jgi:transposase